jgi:carboxyl-terminal processing protease
MANYLKICKTTLFGLILTVGIAASAYGLEETGGIGMTVAQLFDELRDDHRGSLVVLDVFPDSPAQEAGIRCGDIITHIDGQLTRGRDFMKLLTHHLRGSEGSPVRIKVWRASAKKRLEMTITRVGMVY